MTTAITDLPGIPSSKRLLLISLAVLAVVGLTIAWFTFAYARDLWDGRHDIAVRWDPEIPSGQPFGPGRTASPEGTRFAVRHQGQMLLVDVPDRTPIADLGDVSDVAWISEDVLVAFATSIRGDFEGLAVIDIADQSVEQVDTDGRTDAAFEPVSVTDDGLVQVCSTLLEPGSSSATCGPDRFLIDPVAAELAPA